MTHQKERMLITLISQDKVVTVSIFLTTSNEFQGAEATIKNYLKRPA